MVCQYSFSVSVLMGNWHMWCVKQLLCQCAGREFSAGTF